MTGAALTVRVVLALIVTLALALVASAVTAGLACGGPVWCAKQVTF